MNVPRFATEQTWGALTTVWVVKAPHVPGDVGRFNRAMRDHGAPRQRRCKAWPFVGRGV